MSQSLARRIAELLGASRRDRDGRSRHPRIHTDGAQRAAVRAPRGHPPQRSALVELERACLVMSARRRRLSAASAVRSGGSDADVPRSSHPLQPCPGPGQGGLRHGDQRRFDHLHWGLSSGIDTSSIVTQLIAVESAARTLLINQQNIVNLQQQDYSDISAKLPDAEDRLRLERCATSRRTHGPRPRRRPTRTSLRRRRLAPCGELVQRRGVERRPRSGHGRRRRRPTCRSSARCTRRAARTRRPRRS